MNPPAQESEPMLPADVMTEALGERALYNRDAIELRLGESVLRFLEVARGVEVPDPEADNADSQWKGMGSLVLDLYSQTANTSIVKISPLDNLTDQQKQVADMLLYQDYSLQDIADALAISRDEAVNESKKIYRKTRTNNREDLFRRVGPEQSNDNDIELDLLSELPVRQAEILGYIVRGVKDAESIAEILGYKSANSVYMRTTDMYAALGVDSRFKAVKIGFLLKKAAETAITQLIEEPEGLPSKAEIMLSKLSPAQRNQLGLMAQGKNAGEIAEATGIDKESVYKVNAKIRKKLGLKSDQEAIALVRTEPKPIPENPPDFEEIGKLPIFKLSMREAQQLSLVLQGRTNAEIATFTQNSEATVITRYYAILRKLERSSYEEAFAAVEVNPKDVSLRAFYYLCKLGIARATAFYEVKQKLETAPEEAEIYDPREIYKIPVFLLTPGQFKLLSMIAENKPEEQIAEELGISPINLRSNIDYLLKVSLGVNTSAEAAVLFHAKARNMTIPEFYDLPLSKLSKRELQVLCLAAQDKTNQEIAAEMGVTRRLIEIHWWNRIIPRLGITSRAEAIAMLGPEPRKIEPEDYYSLTPVQRDTLAIIGRGEALKVVEVAKQRQTHKTTDAAIIRRIKDKLGLQTFSMLQFTAVANNARIQTYYESPYHQARLTSAQIKAVQLSVEHLSPKAAAAQISVHEGTVRIHLTAAYKKLGVSNLYEASLLLDPPTAEQAEGLDISVLDETEQKIFADIQSSHPHQDLVDRLSHSSRYFEAAISAIKSKLGVSSNIELARWAYAYRLREEERLSELTSGFPAAVTTFMNRLSANKVRPTKIDDTIAKNLLNAGSIGSRPELVQDDKVTTSGYVASVMLISKYADLFKSPSLADRAIKTIVAISKKSIA